MPQLTPTTLTTARLVLRWLTPDDAPAQFSLFSDPEVTRYWSTPAWTDLAQARAFVDAALADYASGEGLRFSILLRDSGTFIGSIKLYDFFDQNRRCDVGYALLPAHWGKGYLAEAMTALLDYAFHTLDLNRIEADIDPRNEASARLLEKLAFQKEGYMRERWIVNGEICDTAFYGLIKRDWDARSLPDA
jgi:RimJ/RimL family protein N-acetyltransferase